MHSGAGSLLRLLTTTAIVRVGGALAQLLMTIAITRSMPSESAGEVLFAYALIMLVGQVSLLGTEVSGLRSVAIDLARDDLSTLRSDSATRIRFVSVTSTIGGVLAVGLVAWATRGDPDRLSVTELVMTGAAIPLYCAILLLAELCKGAGKPTVALLFQNIVIPVLVIGAIAIRETASSGASPKFVISAIVLACAISFLVLLQIYSRTIGMTLRHMHGDSLIRLLKEAPWVAPISATPSIIQWSGAALLGVIAAPSDVAAYVVASRVTIAVSIIHSAVASIAAPRLAKAWHSCDILAFRSASIITGLFISAVALPILAAVFIFPQPILEIFGSAYVDEGAELIRILVVGQVIAAIIGHSGTALTMAGHFRIAAINSAFSGVLQIALILALVPTLGALGAALATSITATLGHIATLILVRVFLRLWPIATTLSDLRLGLQGMKL